MREGLSAFYDPQASPYYYEAQRWLRDEAAPHPPVGRGAVAIAVAGLLLLGFVAADASAYFSLPTKVTITEVQWYVANYSLGNQSGFSVLSGHAFTEDAVCEIFCVAFTGAVVDSPFVLENATFAYPWFEYANLTIRAPDASYSGPLEIHFEV